MLFSLFTWKNGKKESTVDVNPFYSILDSKDNLIEKSPNQKKAKLNAS
jgi:hypothetical protein